MQNWFVVFAILGEAKIGLQSKIYNVHSANRQDKWKLQVKQTAHKLPDPFMQLEVMNKSWLTASLVDNVL